MKLLDGVFPFWDLSRPPSVAEVRLHCKMTFGAHRQQHSSARPPLDQQCKTITVTLEPQTVTEHI